MAKKKKTDTPDLPSMASDYMDLWQKQLSAFASDEAVASVMAQTARLMNNSAAAVAAMSMGAAGQASAGKGQDGTSGKPGTVRDTTQDSKAPGTATTGAPSGADDYAVDQLTERLERLEERIAALESGTVKTGK